MLATVHCRGPAAAGRPARCQVAAAAATAAKLLPLLLLPLLLLPPLLPLLPLLLLSLLPRPMLPLLPLRGPMSCQSTRTIRYAAGAMHDCTFRAL